jgi:hypothetical protein
MYIEHIAMKRTFGIGRCGKCRKPFEKQSPNQKYCSGCSFYIHYASGRLYGKIVNAEKGLKQAADESGNPKVWTAAEHSQDFLRSLIPPR